MVEALLTANLKPKHEHETPAESDSRTGRERTAQAELSGLQVRKMHGDTSCDGLPCRIGANAGARARTTMRPKWLELPSANESNEEAAKSAEPERAPHWAI